MKNTILRGVLSVLPVVLLMACEPVNSIEVQELEGTWIASQARVVNIEFPKRNNVDIIELGYEATFEADAQGSFVLVVEAPDGSSEVRVGMMLVNGKNIAITTDTGSGAGEVFKEEEQVAFRLDVGLSYDFDGFGKEVPVRLLLVMDRVQR
jgi:hypothetical protein